MAPALPKYDELMWPALLALRELGGSGTVSEIEERVISRQKYTAEQQAVPHLSGGSTEIEYRLAWARTYLKGIGAIQSSKRSVWALTERGKTITESEMQQASKEFRAAYYAKRRAAGKKKADEIVDAPTEEDWKDRLLGRLLVLKPATFERLAQRLLREAGFTNVNVTGRSGDGGIDGTGVYRLSLVSFPTFFQCKRYKGSVPPKEVRDFRGAMEGRGDKGLLITTGSFSRDAVVEATRAGATPIELIDGTRLCDLLKEYRLGVSVKERTEEDVIIEDKFFGEL